MPNWEFGPQWMNRPRPASRNCSVFWGSLERRTLFSGSSVTAGAAAVFAFRAGLKKIIATTAAMTTTIRIKNNRILFMPGSSSKDQT